MPGRQYLLEEARERLLVDRFVNELHDPLVAFAIHQRQPKTIATAIMTALEMPYKPHLQAT